MNFKKTTFKNGLRLITVPMKETRTVTAMVMAGVGSRYESDREAGLSHFLEHMLFKGTKKRPTTLVISEELDAIGGEFNAFTGKDRTMYFAKADAEHAGLILDVISDMYLNSKMEETEIEREKGTILQELNMYEDLPMRIAENLFEEMLYPKNPLGREIIGTKKSIRSFRQKDFFDYLRRFYLANDTVVCVAGKINERKIIQETERLFLPLRPGKKPRIERVKENQGKAQVKIRFKKTDQTHLVLGVRAFRRDHKDRYALGLLSIILGGIMSSRLFIEVRERLGLAYYIRTGGDSFEDAGYLAAMAGVEHKNLELAVRVILQEFSKMAKEGVSDKELKKAKDCLRGKAIMGLEASDEVAGFFISQEIEGEKIKTLEEKIALIEKVKKEDIRRVAREIFQNKNLSLAVVGPHRSASGLRRILKIG